MKKVLVGALIAVIVFALWLLLSRQSRTEPEGLKRETAGAVPKEAEAGKAGAEGARSPALATAYVPDVVVMTNGVLAHDTREQLKIGSVEWDLYRHGDQREASERGAEAKVTFHVVDEDGNCVTNADVSANMEVDRSDTVHGKTNADGLFSVEGRITIELIYSVQKEGYYRTRSKFSFGRFGVRCVKDGRWIPWNPTLRVTLKGIRKPIPMYTKRIDVPMPVKDLSVGFDFEVGDWVVPYGKGASSDMQLTYTWITGEGTWRRHDFTIEFAKSLDGAYITTKDEYCPFMSEYEARQEGPYLKRFQYAYERTNDKILQDNKLDDHEIMVFRVRSEKDQQGEITSTRYGKIYGPFEFAQGREKLVRFNYYFNPTPNDRNLEFDGKNNLFDPMWLNLSWPK